MGGIFVSYRREDSSAYAGRLYDRLSQHFGPEHVFMDIDAIGPGEDFREVIHRTCSSCDVLLAVIGKSWLTAIDRAGRPRLQDEADFVRLEISLALRSGLRVIPILVGGAEMPDSRGLPPDLADLAFRNAWEISDKRFRLDVDGLIEAVEKLLQREKKAAVPETSKTGSQQVEQDINGTHGSPTAATDVSAVLSALIRQPVGRAQEAVPPLAAAQAPSAVQLAQLPMNASHQSGDEADPAIVGLVVIGAIGVAFIVFLVWAVLR